MDDITPESRKLSLKLPFIHPTPRHNLPRKEWATLNQIAHEKFGYLMHNWSLTSTSDWGQHK